MSTMLDDDVFISDEEREQRAAAELEEARDRDAWQWLMGSAHGRRIARGLIAVSGMLDSGYSSEAFAAGYREGQRSIGAWALHAVRNHAPDQFTTLFEDQDERSRS